MSKILIIDDDPDFLYTVQMVLDRAGFDTESRPYDKSGFPLLRLCSGQVLAMTNSGLMFSIDYFPDCLSNFVKKSLNIGSL